VSPRRRLLIAAVSVLVVALLVVVGVRSLGGRRAAERPDQTRPGAVVLVPGYGGSVAALSSLAERLRGGGRAATVVALPGDGTGDLLTQASVLDAAVRRALRDGAPSVDIIGYSAGGVVARLWVDRYRGASTVRRVVTLGSPLHGARLAAEGAALAPDACPAACRQLAPGSELLTRLGGAPLPAGLPWLSVWTENDETVQPPDSARLAGAVNVPVQGICPEAHISHGELPTDPLVTALVRQAVGAGPLTVPTTCAALRAAA
jgi:triacylglycerol lipase